MGINYSTTNIHWNYFLAIESDFEKISRYVEFSALNNSTFSIEFARIIMAATQEIDSLMKLICPILDSGAVCKNINDYRNVISAQQPHFTFETVYAKRFGMDSQPWSNWHTTGANPDWWTANNDIKHDRANNFEKANLHNAFNAVGALLVTTVIYYQLLSHANIKNVIENLIPGTILITMNDDYYTKPGFWAEIGW